ncbi:MAG: biopolymer transporter ExbD [Puniceicoccaceae bacterium]|nr:MAG: biopolymer transporter ExbD [Puniceicoccaceae bacterium]
MRITLRDEESFEVQMAPLIDCVFLLLIFFLVATTLKQIDRELPLELPEAAAAIDVQQPEEFHVIAVDETGALYLDGAPISLTLLRSNLRELGQANPETKIRLDIDQNAHFRSAMEVMDTLRFEGFNNVGINTRREPNWP